MSCKPLVVEAALGNPWKRAELQRDEDIGSAAYFLGDPGFAVDEFITFPD